MLLREKALSTLKSPRIAGRQLQFPLDGVHKSIMDMRQVDNRDTGISKWYVDGRFSIY